MTTMDVLGKPVATGKRVLFHEHIQFGWPGFDLDYLSRKTDPIRAVSVLDELARYGYGVLVDATTIECGRDLALLRSLAEQTSLQVVASTGIYQAAKGFPDHLASLTVDELGDLFEHDLSDNLGTGRAGVIKVAAEKLPLAKREAKAIAAAGQTSAARGVSVVAHAVHVDVAEEILRIFEDNGGAAHRIVLGHLDGERRREDAVKQLARRGAFIGIDRFGAGGEAVDVERIELLLALREAGLLGSVLISHDRPLTFLGRVDTGFGEDNLFLHIERAIVPELSRRGITPSEIETLLAENPARFLCGEGERRSDT
jgi:phosphotriesterase-related protein